MKHKLKIIYFLLLITAVLFITFWVILYFIWLPNTKLPVNSKANTLQLALYGGTSAYDIEITLVGQKSSFSIYVKGVYAGEPQQYRLPSLKDDEYTVHLKYNSKGTPAKPLDSDIFILKKQDIKKNGLLVYFTDLNWGVEVVCGDIVVSYKTDTKNEICITDNDPPDRYETPEGAGLEYYSGWRSNKWLEVRYETSNA